MSKRLKSMVRQYICPLTCALVGFLAGVLLCLPRLPSSYSFAGLDVFIPHRSPMHGIMLTQSVDALELLHSNNTNTLRTYLELILDSSILETEARRSAIRTKDERDILTTALGQAATYRKQYPRPSEMQEWDMSGALGGDFSYGDIDELLANTLQNIEKSDSPKVGVRPSPQESRLETDDDSD